MCIGRLCVWCVDATVNASEAYKLVQNQLAGYLSWLERRANNANVVGSTPTLATFLFTYLHTYTFLLARYLCISSIWFFKEPSPHPFRPPAPFHL